MIESLYMQSSHQIMTIEKWFFLFIAILVIYLFWTIIQPFALVLLSASVFAIILSPINRRLTHVLKHPRISAAMIASGVLLLIFVPVLLLSLLMARQASDLIQNSFQDTGWIDGLRQEFLTFMTFLPASMQESIVSFDLTQLSVSVATWAFKNIGFIFSSATTLIVNTFLFFIGLYYLMVEREKIYTEILALTPLNDTIDTAILKRIIDTVRSVVFGVLILAVIQGIVATIGMTIFGVPGALIWGSLTALAALVPLVGSALIMIPAILYLFITGSTGAGIGLLIWAVVVVGLADNILGPYLIKGTTRMHAFLVLISVLGGLQIYGSIGIIAGPTILAALLALLELYQSGILTTGKLNKKT